MLALEHEIISRERIIGECVDCQESNCLIMAGYEDFPWCRGRKIQWMCMYVDQKWKWKFIGSTINMTKDEIKLDARLLDSGQASCYRSSHTLLYIVLDVAQVSILVYFYQ